MVSGGMKCVKYLLFVFNLIFFFAGLGLVGLGVLAQVKFREYSGLYDSSDSDVNKLAVFLIVTGSVIFIISFFGCVGAYKENYCMIYTYAFLLGLILLLEFAVVLVAYLYRKQINLDKLLESTMPNYSREKAKVVTEAWNKAQQELSCCGRHSYRDWSVNPILNASGSVPDSCCMKVTNDCGKGIIFSLNVSTIYTEGCVDKVIFWAGEHNPVIQGVVAGLAVLELLCVVFACCLARSIRREYEAV